MTAYRRGRPSIHRGTCGRHERRTRTSPWRRLPSVQAMHPFLAPQVRGYGTRRQPHDGSPGNSPVPRGAETPFLSGRKATDRMGCQDSVAGKGGIPVWSGIERGGRVSETAMMAPSSLKASYSLPLYALWTHHPLSSNRWRSPTHGDRQYHCLLFHRDRARSGHANLQWRAGCLRA